MKAADRGELAEIRRELGALISADASCDDEQTREFIEDYILMRPGGGMSFEEKKRAVDNIFNSLRRLDLLQPLIDDPTVTEIMVNGTESIFAERGGVMTRLVERFEDPERLLNIIQSMVSTVNRSVNESTPIVDARLPDGSRINAVLNPVALNGPILTVRKFPEKPFTMAELIRGGFTDEETAGFLKTLVERKYSIFICGGTSTGKTTLLNALANYIPAGERIITIEDSAELRIEGHDNMVVLEARNANTEGRGRISIRDLIKASLRMRPDRIVVGEVRGDESVDMLQVMNTGHEGSLCTGHANSGRDMLSRLETMVLCAANIPLAAIRRQIAAALDIIVYLERSEKMRRRIVTIDEVDGFDGDDIALNRLYTYTGPGIAERGVLHDVSKLAKTE